MDAGTRNLYAKKAIKRPPDLKGQKIRMMGNPIFLETMNAMGGTGVSMGFTELYSAMQTGVVDGAENNTPTYLTQNHYQITKYYNLTGHLIIPEILVFSKRSWEKLSNEDRALIKKLAREAQIGAAPALGRDGDRVDREAEGRRSPVRRGRQEGLLRRGQAGTRQVRREVRGADQAHRRHQVNEHRTLDRTRPPARSLESSGRPPA